MESCRKHFNRITRIAGRYNALCATDGLTAHECQTLRIISIHHEMTQQALANHLGVDKSQVTRLVHKLEAAGYLTRTVNEEDRREKRITSTHKADAVKQQNFEVADRYYQYLLSALPEKEREQFIATLQSLSERALALSRNHFAELENEECN